MNPTIAPNVSEKPAVPLKIEEAVKLATQHRTPPLLRWRNAGPGQDPGPIATRSQRHRESMRFLASHLPLTAHSHSKVHRRVFAA